MAFSIGSVIDAIRVAIPGYSNFSTKLEIPNPYSLEDNPINYMDDSWGLIVGSGTRGSKEELAIMDYVVTTNRPVSVILSRKVYEIHTIDKAINEEVKNLFIDANTIRNNFLSLSKFGVLKGGEEITYIGDTGVNFINGDKFNLIYTQIDFEFEIVETIN
jgi:hypothetical protein